MNMINDLEGKAKEFATACFENSIEELESALENGADQSDCAEWGITASEWVDAVQAALNEKKQ